MTNQSPFIRVAAVGSIKRLGTNATDAIPDLIAALSDPDIYLRQNAAQALETQGLRRGLWLSARRLLRCRPGATGGVDPVPPAR